MRGADQGLNLHVKIRSIANYLQVHAFGVHVVHFFAQIEGQQAQQAGHFMRWALPVFGAEGKQGDEAQGSVRAGPHNAAHPVGTAAVAERRWQTELLGPTPIGIHGDANVLRIGLGNPELND